MVESDGDAVESAATSNVAHKVDITPNIRISDVVISYMSVGGGNRVEVKCKEVEVHAVHSREGASLLWAAPLDTTVALNLRSRSRPPAIYWAIGSWYHRDIQYLRRPCICSCCNTRSGCFGSSASQQHLHSESLVRHSARYRLCFFRVSYFFDIFKFLI